MLTVADNCTFKPGQVWSYSTRIGEESSTLTILMVEESSKLGVIVHIRVDGAKSTSKKDPQNIEHLPFSEQAIKLSVNKLENQVTAPPVFAEGYSIWRKAFDSGKAGVFTGPVSEVIEVLLKGMAQ